MKRYDNLIEAIDKAKAAHERVFVAIDGDAAAGKTTLAQNLRQLYDCNVVPMDDFFLPPDLRTESRLAEPGGNVDYDRFKLEVLEPLLAGRGFSYRPFDCRIWDFADAVSFAPAKLTIVEGSYSLHPLLADAYHIKVFLKLDEDEQKRRILARNGAEMAEKFKNIWIPMEKRYHAAFGIEATCDFCYGM